MIGYFGKVSTHGDFVSRGLPPDLVAAWDAWLQQCMLASQQQLGDQWLTHYLTSPVWRFAISPGILGAEGLGGVMMPSVDRVGRYFPLMIGATGAPPLLDWFQKQAEWYDAIEEVARASLDAGFRVEQFNPLSEPMLASEPSAAMHRSRLGWRLPLRASMAEWVAEVTLQGYSLWWTEGAPSVVASLLVCDGLPPPEGYGLLLEEC